MMKTIYYCDRCKTELKEKPMDNMATYPETRLKVFYAGDFQIAHLCPRCKESFSYWWTMEDNPDA